MKFYKYFFLFLGVSILPQYCWGSADYAQDLRDQAAQLDRKNPLINAEYFRDRGIIVRKADDADESALAAEMIRGLLGRMDEFMKKEIESINAQYERDAFQASRRLQDLTRYDRYFQPSENFSKTALGRAINGDIVQFRSNAMDAIHKSCAPQSLLAGVQAIKRTGLYITGSASEIDAMRDLTNAVNGCLSWKQNIVFFREQPFETLYEKGLLTEDSKLRLESSRADLSQARWTGEWVYRYTGRDGKGEGVSQAILTYRRGEDTATLVISTSRVSSTGRMNFPNSYSNEKRTLEVTGTPLYPQFIFFEAKLNAAGPEQKP